MKSHKSIEKFWLLADQGLSAALDINTQGELECRRTIANTHRKEEGLGTPPLPFEFSQRITICNKGIISRGN